VTTILVDEFKLFGGSVIRLLLVVFVLGETAFVKGVVLAADWAGGGCEVVSTASFRFLLAPRGGVECASLEGGVEAKSLGLATGGGRTGTAGEAALGSRDLRRALACEWEKIPDDAELGLNACWS